MVAMFSEAFEHLKENLGDFRGTHSAAEDKKFDRKIEENGDVDMFKEFEEFERKRIKTPDNNKKMGENLMLCITNNMPNNSRRIVIAPGETKSQSIPGDTHLSAVVIMAKIEENGFLCLALAGSHRLRGESAHRLYPCPYCNSTLKDGLWTVDCSSDINYNDGEEMVNCDKCGVWVHTKCSSFVKGETSFVCHKCKLIKKRTTRRPRRLRSRSC
ncbi:hypothetical protein SUGI_0132120 [Cryptomeria japonica]|nr:hypothetical protein SUGI_0132120 [Cryptomeria japonica]